MKIKYVTLTGADDRTSISRMRELSQEYPYVEWAILFSQSKIGFPRYPSFGWVVEAVKTLGLGKFSAHLCGKWVDDAINGKLTFIDSGLGHFFNRLQLNMSRGRLQQCLSSDTRIWECDFYRPTIFGGSYSSVVPIESFRQFGISPLFDSSGGKGISAEKWPNLLFDKHGKPLFCGYAGGLGPDNIESELEKISGVVGDYDVWVDMETKLRKNNKFDLGICRQILETVKPWT